MDGRAGDAHVVGMAPAPELRSADPRGRPVHAPGQGGHADHGRGGPGRGQRGRVPDRPCGDARGLQSCRHPRGGRDGGGGRDRVRRRLDQGAPPTQPGPEQESQVRRSDTRGPRVRPGRRALGGVDTHLSFTRWNSVGIDLGSVGWLVWAVFVVVGTANAVNLTDGLDGLASGSATFCFAILAIIGYWQFRHYSIYHVASALDLALTSIALAGACLGFLWWNAAPARIFMGDTGSLAIGAAIAALALPMNLQLLLPGDRWTVRHRHPLGGRPGRQLPGLRATGLPHGAAAPSLRASRLARDDGDRALLDPRPASSPPSGSASSTPTSSRSRR